MGAQGKAGRAPDKASVPTRVARAEAAACCGQEAGLSGCRAGGAAAVGSHAQHTQQEHGQCMQRPQKAETHAVRRKKRPNNAGAVRQDTAEYGGGTWNGRDADDARDLVKALADAVVQRGACGRRHPARHAWGCQRKTRFGAVVDEHADLRPVASSVVPAAATFPIQALMVMERQSCMRRLLEVGNTAPLVRICVYIIISGR